MSGLIVLDSFTWFEMMKFLQDADQQYFLKSHHSLNGWEVYRMGSTKKMELIT